MRGYDLWHREREEAATVHPNGVRTLALDSGKRFEAMVWNPNAKKPTTHISFKDVAMRDAYILSYVEEYDRAQHRKAADRAERKAKQDAGDVTKADPGAILSYSWGYEQTQVEYWQVVERKGRMVTLRRICSHSVQAVSWASDRVEPVKDAFIDPPCGVPDCGMGKEWRGHGSSGAYEHDYVPGNADVVKRFSFDSEGNPCVKFDFGSGSLVKPGQTEYRSWYN